MARQGGHASTLAIAVCLALTGCASVGDLAARPDPLLAQLAERLDRDDWRPDPAWSPDSAHPVSRWRLGPPSGTDDGATIETLLAERNESDPAERGDHPLLVL